MFSQTHVSIDYTYLCPADILIDEVVTCIHAPANNTKRHQQPFKLPMYNK